MPGKNKHGTNREKTTKKLSTSELKIVTALLGTIAALGVIVFTLAIVQRNRNDSTNSNSVPVEVISNTEESTEESTEQSSAFESSEIEEVSQVENSESSHKLEESSSEISLSEPEESVSEQSSDVSSEIEESETEESSQSLIVDYAQIYKPVLDVYSSLSGYESPISDAITALNEAEIVLNKVTDYMVSCHFAEYYLNYPDRIPFVLHDIDNDGVEELMILSPSASVENNAVEYTSIWGIYTVSEEKVTAVALGWTRSHYELGDDGCIYYGGSGGASSTTHIQYRYSNGTLTAQEIIWTDGDPITYYYAENGSEESGQEIPYNNYNQIRTEWGSKYRKLTPSYYSGTNSYGIDAQNISYFQEIYKPVLDLYIEIIEMGEMKEVGIDVFRAHCEDLFDISSDTEREAMNHFQEYFMYLENDLPYGLYDIDDNGILELLIFSPEQSEFENGTTGVYGIYTIINGRITAVGLGRPRVSYEVGDDQCIYFHASGGAADNEDYRLFYKDGITTELQRIWMSSHPETSERYISYYYSEDQALNDKSEYEVPEETYRTISAEWASHHITFPVLFYSGDVGE